MPPPPSIRATKSLSSQKVIDFTRGVDANYFLGEGNYATYIQTHLMPLLTGTQAHAGSAADVPSTSRARALRGKARGMPSARQSFSWPELPTELTSYSTPERLTGFRLSLRWLVTDMPEHSIYLRHPQGTSRDCSRCWPHSRA